MQTVTIQTSQNIGIDYEIAGLGERVVARIIDYAIFFAVCFLVVMMMSIGMSAKNEQLLLFICFIFLGILYVFYDLICEVFFNGQSIGKRVMKIRVISLEGNRPTFGQYLLRWLFRLVDFVITFQVGGLICAAVTQNCQRMGDLVAGTTLIKTQPRTQRAHLEFAPPLENYEAVFTQAVDLRDRDIILINDVLHNYYNTGNYGLLSNMAAKVSEHLSISIPSGMNELTFLRTVIKDYNYLSAQDTATAVL